MMKTNAICAALMALTAAMTAVSTAQAADIFVRPTQGNDLPENQAAHLTNLVQKAVSEMPEHRLVNNESRADFVLAPTVIDRNGEAILRIQKLKDGETLAQSEEKVDSIKNSSKGAMAATETALAGDRIADDMSGHVVDTKHNGAAFSDQHRPADAAADETTERQSAINQHHAFNEEGRELGATNRAATGDTVSGTTEPASDENSSGMLGRTSEPGVASGRPLAEGDVRGASPRFQRPDRMGAFQVGIGPAFGAGFGSDQPLYDVTVGYAAPINDMVSAKGFGDFNLAAGTDPNRFLNFGVGADLYPLRAETMANGRPYVMGDVGYAFTQNKSSNTESAPAVGAGAGFKFTAQQLNMDINMHYTILTAQLNSTFPSVLGLRAALNF